MPIVSNSVGVGSLRDPLIARRLAAKSREIRVPVVEPQRHWATTSHGALSPGRLHDSSVSTSTAYARDAAEPSLLIRGKIGLTESPALMTRPDRFDASAGGCAVAGAPRLLRSRKVTALDLVMDRVILATAEVAGLVISLCHHAAEAGSPTRL